MNILLSWLKEYVDIDCSLVELATMLTGLGLEVEGVRVVGLPMPEGDRQDFSFSGLPWEREKFVVAQVDEVLPHPNADRLVLCRLNDGKQENLVLTGAPNLFEYKGKGVLEKPLKVAYALEGAQLYDGHQPGLVLTTLKRARIRGVDSTSMICSEKELGISEEHEGIILLDDDAPTGMPLVEYMGDAVFEISILPNMIRNASVLGVAREVAAKTGKLLRKPQPKIKATGSDITGQVEIEITDPALNPRFTVGLLRQTRSQQSPYLVQRRLRLAGMRPINSLVDATNYTMLEIGEPLHAFDYDLLLKRAGGNPPRIITRAAHEGETLTTLDNVERTLPPFSILVTDTAGPLSLAGVMGGLESEITPATTTVLLEGAAWNFVNTRRTMNALKLTSEAGYRFARGVHPALAPYAVQLCLSRMVEWSGGEIARGLVDNYPAPVIDPEVRVREKDVERLVGVHIPAAEMAAILERLEFTCSVDGDTVTAKTPPHRLDIGEGVTGRADLVEEVARQYGFDHIPAQRIAEALPTYKRLPEVEFETLVKDLLVSLGLQEIITYRMTSPEREARAVLNSSDVKEEQYLRLLNPLAPERRVMRRNMLATLLEVLEKNARLSSRLALFELGPVFIPKEGQDLPDEKQRLTIGLTGRRQLLTWDQPDAHAMDFYDLKGCVESLLEGLHVDERVYEPIAGESFHPGKGARILCGGVEIGVLGELHPLVKERYDFLSAPVLLADLDLKALRSLQPARYEVETVITFPPVLEDLAVVLPEDMPAEQAMSVIRKVGGRLLRRVEVFDIFRGEQIGAGNKSLAFSLTYQAEDHTLTDAEVGAVRGRIIKRLEQELGAKIRS